WVEGTGPTIVMCHGGPGGYDQGYMLSHLIDEGFQVLCFSRPGYLRTPIQHNTIEAQASLLNALLVELEIPEVVILGVSAGGPIALAFAQNYPKKTKGLMLEAAVSHEYNPQEEIEGTILEKVFFNAKLQDFLIYFMIIFLAIMPLVIINSLLKIETTLTKEERKVYISYVRSHRIELKWYKTLMDSTAPITIRFDGLLNDLELFKNITETKVNNIQCPTLIVHSQQDNDVKFEHAEYLINKIPQAELFKTFGGHLMWFGPDSDVIKKKRVDFLSKLK
ncbi:MAG: alpha/beta fold hydrolase, partial [Candidatus Heimdallarchaeota archaeon]